MAIHQKRTVLTVLRHDGAWAVECDGEHFGHSTDKEIVKASANRRARELLSGGSSCQVVVRGESSFFNGCPAAQPNLFPSPIAFVMRSARRRPAAKPWTS